METLGSRLKAYRESMGLRQEDLALSLGVKKQYVSNIETGQRGISMEYLTALANLGIDLNYLLTGSGLDTLQKNHQTLAWDLFENEDYLIVPLVPTSLQNPENIQYLLNPKRPEKKRFWRGIWEYGIQDGQYVKKTTEEKEKIKLYDSFYENLKKVPAPRRLVKNDLLFAAEVRGDSMIGAQLYDGDVVFFSPNEIRGDGIYVLYVEGEALIKRLEFDPFEKKIRVCSENPRYPTRIEDQDSKAFTILGKVCGAIHTIL